MFSTMLLTTMLATGAEPELVTNPGLFLRIRARLVGLETNTCGSCGRTIFAGFTTTCHQPIDPCGQPGLIDRLKARFQKVETCALPADCCEAPYETCTRLMIIAPAPGRTPWNACAIPIAPTVQISYGPKEAPQVMPKPPLPNKD